MNRQFTCPPSCVEVMMKLVRSILNPIVSQWVSFRIV
jgi:hypothetical protein